MQTKQKTVDNLYRNQWIFGWKFSQIEIDDYKFATALYGTHKEGDYGADEIHLEVHCLEWKWEEVFWRIES